ncbi:hypothetical protein BEH94_03560 [Candidatus Altiarchaeales archaeon WOR_SM1_SCG]|nr:hypothetical protein BEH94_03560 [Candidatus Altiarchaeales archaeon WOR_SM1_SCG]
MSYTQDHIRIKNAITDEIARGALSVDLNEFSKKLEMDPRTVKNHFDIMEMDGFGMFVNDKKTVFCPKNAVKKMLRKLEGE